MMIWKFIFFTQWTYEKLEEKLERMEQAGFRLATARFFWFFKFVKARPQEVKYVITYSLPRDWGMTDCTYELKRQYGANPIRTGCLFSPEIYRITETDQPLQKIISFRNNYFLHVTIQKLIVSLLFCIPSFIYVFYKNYDLFELDVLFYCMLSISLLGVLYYIVGLFTLTRTHKS